MSRESRNPLLESKNLTTTVQDRMASKQHNSPCVRIQHLGANDSSAQLSSTIDDDAETCCHCGRKVWLIILWHKPDTIETLFSIRGITQSPQTAKTLIQTMAQISEQNVAHLLNMEITKVKLWDTLGDRLESLWDDGNRLKLFGAIFVCRTEATLLSSDNSPQRFIRFPRISQQLWSWIYNQITLPELDLAIQYIPRMLQLCQTDDIFYLDHLKLLAAAYAARCQNTNNCLDIDLAIEHQTQVISIAGVEHEDRPWFHSLISRFYHSRYHISDAAEDINEAVETQIRALTELPDQHNNCLGYLFDLGEVYKCRFEHLGELDDLNQAIECYNLVDLGVNKESSDRLSLLNCLGRAYQDRFGILGELTDIDNAVECYTRAVKLVPVGHTNMPLFLGRLGIAHNSRFGSLGNITDSNKAIEYQTRAIQLTPQGQADWCHLLNDMGASYSNRFKHSGCLSDIDKAINIQTQAVASPSGDDTARSTWFSNLGNSYRLRFAHLGEQLDIDKSIKSHTQAEILLPEGAPLKHDFLMNLGIAHGVRFDHLNELEDSNKAIASTERAVQLLPEGHASKPFVLYSLGTLHFDRFQSLHEPDDIYCAVTHLSKSVLLTPEGHTQLPARLNSLGRAHSALFEHSGKQVDLDEAIECLTMANHLTLEARVSKSDGLVTLGRIHELRFKHLRSLEDIHTAAQYYEIAAKNSNGRPSSRFVAAKDWARLQFNSDQSSSLPAYSLAMELVPKVVWLGSTVNRRYQNIASLGATATEAAAAAISVKEYALALEWLEEGRSIVWSQTLQLRSPLSELSAVHPVLAQELTEFARKLEIAGTREPDVAHAGEFMSASETIAQHHRRHAEDYDRIIRQIRILSGFHNFLRPKRAVELVHAAQAGPVVVINVHTTRCDALVLLPGEKTIGHVPLPDLSHGQVADLRTQIEQSLSPHDVVERRLRRAGDKPMDYFERILAELWYKIAKPILSFLENNGAHTSGKRPHITWCTTGDLSFLPLHAAGCYDQYGADLLELAVSSYTPTLSVLIDSSDRTSTLPTGILAVGQEATAGCAPLPGTRAELACIHRYAEALPHKQLRGQHATVSAVLDAMEEYDSIHLACHASQDIDVPTESGFHLHDGTLSLAKITAKSLKNKRLAFLSACQTATGDTKLPDEAIHLAAGMQVAGYRSVIATMWSIKDSDAPFIADRVYARLLNGGEDDSIGTAEALHNAVLALRAEVGEKAFVRWVPYIHMGV